MSTIYDAPKYYDLAFSWRNIAHEADVLEACAARFMEAKPKRFLELACGNAPYLEELARRGYTYTGLDLSDAMLEFSREKAAAADIDATFIRGDMCDFKLDAPADFAFMLLGSLYVADTAQLMRHFACMVEALRPGGLYFLDWVVDFEPLTDFVETWDMERDGVSITATVATRRLELVDQILEEHVTLEVNDNGVEHTFEDRRRKRAIYPQEFLLLAEMLPGFTFAGWWNSWDLNQPMESATAVHRPIALLQRV
ncbi:MAG: class I SAM-dependent methyltransferase [Candidatus Hydrogenedentes bacterium]|nr:class I SAM-dependent methyltransferase [Candidatus Hydrogenedentota bacterium]